MQKLTLLIILTAPLTFGCYRESDYQPPELNLSNLITLETSLDSIPADGASRLTIYVNDLPDSIADADNNIVIQTDLGSFVGYTQDTATIHSSLIYDTTTNRLKRQGLLTLVSSLKSDSAHLVVMMKGVQKYKTIFFYPALPDDIQIIPSAIYAKASYMQGTAIEVDLTREVGIPSLNTLISMVALGGPGGSFQQYSNKSNALGKCFFNYIFTDTTFTGPITFTVSVKSVGGDSIMKSFNLNIYK